MTKIDLNYCKIKLNLLLLTLGILVFELLENMPFK